MYVRIKSWTIIYYCDILWGHLLRRFTRTPERCCLRSITLRIRMAKQEEPMLNLEDSWLIYLKKNFHLKKIEIVTMGRILPWSIQMKTRKTYFTIRWGLQTFLQVIYVTFNKKSGGNFNTINFHWIHFDKRIHISWRCDFNPELMGVLISTNAI